MHIITVSSVFLCLYIMQLADVSGDVWGRENHDQIRRWSHFFPKACHCLLYMSLVCSTACSWAINRRATVVSRAVSDLTKLRSHVLRVYVCAHRHLLYLARPNEACCCLRGETLDPIACYWYRQPTPSAAAVNFFTCSPQFRLHLPGVRFTSHCASGAACLHPLIWRQLLMGRPISPVRSTSGNHEARRKKQQGENALMGLVKWEIIVFFCTHEMFHWLANLLSDFHSKWCALNVLQLCV